MISLLSFSNVFESIKLITACTSEQLYLTNDVYFVCRIKNMGHHSTLIALDSPTLLLVLILKCQPSTLKVHYPIRFFNKPLLSSKHNLLGVGRDSRIYRWINFGISELFVAVILASNFKHLGVKILICCFISLILLLKDSILLDSTGPGHQMLFLLIQMV